MKKILIVDFLFVEAHKVMNINLIEGFARKFEVCVLSVNGYYADKKEEWNKKGIELKDIRITSHRDGAILGRLYSLILMSIAKKVVKKNSFDMVVSLAFDTLAFGLGEKYFRNIPFAVFHHKNIDELANNIKRKVFDTYKNRIYHFVFEDFFAKYLISSIAVNHSRVMVLPHPIETEKATEKVFPKEYDCIGLCNSNSDKFIKRILEMNDEFAKYNLKILLRSKVREIEKSNVKIIYGFLESDTYYRYIDGTNSVLVAIPETYVYRLSGSIYDALSRRKVVFTTSKFYGYDYQRRYPGICIYVGDEEDFFNKLYAYEYNDEIEASFNKFILDHTIQCSSALMAKYVMQILGG